MRARHFRHIEYSFDGLPYRFFFDRVPGNALPEVVAWCLDQYGEPTPPGSRSMPPPNTRMPPIGRYAVYEDGAIISFHQPDDVFAFKMRWG